MPRGKPNYRLTLDDVLDAHDEALRYGGLTGYVDLALVESAIARPYTTFAGKRLYPTISKKAAALAESLVQNHGFIDGNKRTALICLGILLERSGYTLSQNVSNKDIENLMLEIAESKVSFDHIDRWLRQRIVRSR